MLREIINFTNSLSPESFTRNLQPKEGLHIQVDLDDHGKLINHEKSFYKKDDELKPFLQGCLERQLHTKWVSSFKPLDPDQKIHSCSPFCVAFKRLDKRHQVDLLDNQSQFQKSLSKYFETALRYCETDEQKRWAGILAAFCKNDLTDIVKAMEGYPDLKKEDYICIYLKNAGLNDYRETHSRYLAVKVFNKEKFNKIVREETYGVSDYLTGYNSKKPFIAFVYGFCVRGLLYSLFSILYSLFSILYSLFSILYSLFSIL